MCSGHVVPDMLSDLTQDVLPDVFPVVSAGEAAVPWPLPAVDESVPQAIFKKEAAPMVVPLIEEMSLRDMSGCQDVLRTCFRSCLPGRLLCRGPCRQ